MARQMLIYVPTEAIPPGTQAVLYGTDGAGSIDTSVVLSGGRVGAHKGVDQWATGDKGPAGQAVAGRPTPPLLLFTPRLVFGAFKFAVGLLSSETGARSADPLEEVTVNANAKPIASDTLSSQAATDSDGRLVFDFAKGVLTA